ncbi:hypothetical protein CROQUDRAFT_92557 [Cronartium quercuum f. sp. fusiforme G11]|uniref:Uncharacterized protein n=1 Tax=Cronartium quercuum f. sp. fusiforme G11 TaxID=708437 RepID=A0A9P6TCB3_9BASI|nr:hypothetical protein CROQUDRAFT_92557 [Cronartium quercuum f. sp. fusiforme G11]
MTVRRADLPAGRTHRTAQKYRARARAQSRLETSSYTTGAVGPAQDGRLPATLGRRPTMAGGPQYEIEMRSTSYRHLSSPARSIGARCGLLTAIQACIEASSGGPVRPKRLLASDRF